MGRRKGSKNRPKLSDGEIEQKLNATSGAQWREEHQIDTPQTQNPEVQKEAIPSFESFFDHNNTSQPADDWDTPTQPNQQPYNEQAEEQIIWVPKEMISNFFKVENKLLVKYFGKECELEASVFNSIGAAGEKPVSRIFGKYLKENADLAAFAGIVAMSHAPIALILIEKLFARFGTKKQQTKDITKDIVIRPPQPRPQEPQRDINVQQPEIVYINPEVTQDVGN